MRLSKIKLAGFKSFVDPTTINFPGNLVSILGPNGCGKSNTIDAVRWVMGESSAKNLRGESMTDVIFNGSSARKPVGQAMVELIFDNSDGKLGGQYSNFNEVSVKRTINRDAQSFYYLNNTRCRRKDVTEIFLGTGLGPRSYSIIEQGTISKLIESKPEELRVYIEEAAGISKYKERRRETENRMRHTRENLQRLEDIRGELDKQLAKLQRQARSAKRYKELKHHERELKAQLNAIQWRTVDNQSEQQQSEIFTTEIELEKNISQLRQVELLIEKKRQTHHQSNENFNQIQGDFYRIGSDIARLEQSIEHAHERNKQHQEDFSEANSAYALAKQHSQLDKEKINHIKVQLEELLPQLDDYHQQLELSQQQLEESEQAMYEWQMQWDEYQHSAGQPAQIAQVERTKINQSEQQLQQLQRKIARLEQELANDCVEPLQLELDALRIEYHAVKEQTKNLELQLGHQKKYLLEHFEQLQLANKELNKHSNTLSQLNGKKSSLMALQTAALGKDNHHAINWLKQHNLEDNKRLTHYLSVPSGWETAIEYLLGDALEAVCVSSESYHKTVDKLTLAKVPEFLLMLMDHEAGDNSQKKDLSNQQHGFLMLSELIDANSAVKRILANIIAAPTLSKALKLLPKLDKKYTIICQDGYYLGHDWIKVIYSKNEKTGVLLREKSLQALKLEINSLVDLVSKQQSAIEALRILQLATEDKKEQFQQQIQQQQQLQSDLKIKVNNKQLRIEHIENRKNQISLELAENTEQISDLNEDIEIASQILHQALEDIDIHEEKKQVFTRQKEEIQLQLHELKENHHDKKDKSFNLQIRVNSLQSELTITQQALSRVSEQLEGLKNRCQQLNDLIQTQTAPVEQLELQLENYLSQKLLVDENLSQARNTLDDLDQQVRLSESNRVELEQIIDIIRGKLEQARIFWQELKVKRQAQQENLDASDFILSELLLQIPEDAKEPDWQQQLRQLNQKIQSLGAINLAAIDEYQDQQQRKEYLDSQNMDLVEALTTLESAIAKIDRETRTRFKSTFDHINSELQLLFPRLFGGGHAYLDLTGDDFLNTGVTIMARPPGKRNSTIHLLSGGEKAMTAVALVFSIFSLNPSPFCMLDEVDAPLDEANVGRFCQMVKEMSEQLQFIYITHNKTTMEMSDYLCGVTMKEAGVSRIVDVDIHEAVDMIEA